MDSEKRRKFVKRWGPNPEHRARIHWLSPEEGGRRNPPGIDKYRGISRFDEDPNHRLGFWDLVVRFEIFPTSEDRDSVAFVSFLADEAPHHLLRAGAPFEVMEGLKTVARGIIVE
jgi:hypothetical protein